MTAALKAAGTAVVFVGSLFYARMLGPHGYGLFAFVTACTMISTLAAGLGLPQYLVREGARQHGSLRSLMTKADAMAGPTGAAAATVLACISLLPEAADARALFLIAAPLPVISNLRGIRQGLLQSQGRVATSQWTSYVGTPIAVLAASGVIWLWGGQITPSLLMVLTLTATALGLLVNHSQLLGLMRRMTQAAHGQIDVRQALTFASLGIMFLLNSRTDLIMLGAIKGAREAGIYAVAARSAELVSFFLMAGNAVLAPQISRLHGRGDLSGLQRLLFGASRRVIVLTLPFALILGVLADPLLGVFYGAPFAASALPLQILILSQIVNVTAGPTGKLLTMTGHQRLAAYCVGAACATNIALNLLLIPILGASGAAIATGISLVTWNALQWFFVRTKLGLRPSLIGA